MGSLNRLAAVAFNTFRETVRERVLYNLVLFAVIMTVSGLLMRELSVRQDEKIIKDVGLAAMDLFGSAIAVFIGVGLVAKEIERRSLFPLLARPLARWEFLLGKFAGLALTLLVNVTVMTAGLLVTLRATGRAADWGLLPAIYAIYLGLLLTVAVALLFSTVSPSLLATIETLCVVLAGRYSDLIRNMQTVVQGAPGWLTHGLYYLIPNFQNFDLKDRVVHGVAVPAALLGNVTLYAAAYVGLALLLAVLAFERREFQ